MVLPKPESRHLINDALPVVRHGGCGSCGSGSASGGARCGNGLEKIYPTTAVRFGYMRFIGEFTHEPELKFSCGAKVVIQTKRGIEIGEQVSLTCGGCDKAVTREQMKEWVKSCGEDSYIFSAGRILREATSSDLAEYARILGGSREKVRFCQETANRRKLPIRVIECECPFGGERLIYYFSAPERIDFRSIVKELAREYRTRIEMRQIGARDEARLLADYETCGREVCCKVFLKTLKPISMRMAKVQKATLDPSQVSGRCGRLKCCLRYEHVGYEELDKKLPKIGIRVSTVHGDGIVVNRQILTQLVQIRDDDGNLQTVVIEDVTGFNVPAPPPVQKEGGASRDPSRRKTPRPPKSSERESSRGRPLRDEMVQGEHRESADTQGEQGSSRHSGDSTGSSEQKSKPPRRKGRRRRGRRRGRSGGGTGGSEPGGSAGG